MNRDEQALAVTRMLEDLSADGVQVAEADRTMLRAFARRTISAADMLAHVRQFASLDDYDDWRRQQTAVQSERRRSAGAFARVLEEVKHCMRRKNTGGSTRIRPV